jgi:hypothetical protein
MMHTADQTAYRGKIGQRRGEEMFTTQTVTLKLGVLALLLAIPGQSVPVGEISDSLLERDAKQFAAYESGETAEQIVARHKNFDPVNNVYLVERHLHEEIQPGHDATNDPLIHLKSLVYNCDAIFIGTPRRRTSALTASHTFVFSDYEVSVDSIALDRTGQLKLGSQVVVSRPGGVVTVDGAQFRAIDSEFPLFRLNLPYIFFGHLSTLSGSFVVNASDAYLIEGNEVKSGRTHSRVLPSAINEGSFMRDLHEAIGSDHRGSR